MDMRIIMNLGPRRINSILNRAGKASYLFVTNSVERLREYGCALRNLSDAVTEADKQNILLLRSN